MSFLRPDQPITFRFAASEASVRIALTDLRRWLAEIGLSPDTCGTVEIVMAEALNNIVEHAYAEQGTGPVDINIQHLGNRLGIELSDRGRPLPGLHLPQGHLPSTKVPLADLPEGGFGWYLIHRLTDALDYERHADQNHLRFEIAINQQAEI